MNLSTLCTTAVVAIALAMPSAALADPVTCTRTINKELGKYIKTLSKEREKCARSVLTSGQPPTLAGCPDPTGSAKIDRAASKMKSKIAQRCGGANATCDRTDQGDDADDSLASINWNIANCLNFESGSNGSCTNDIRDCGDVADCVECIANAAVDQHVGSLLFDSFDPTKFYLSSGNVTRVERRCQRTVAQESVKFLQKKQRLLQKCWDSKLQGKTGYVDADPCPDTDPTPGTGGDNKTVSKIKALELKKIDKICRKCGGAGDDDADGQCDEEGAIVSSGVSINLDDIVTLPFECPEVMVPPNAVHPSGWDCGAIGSPAPNITTVQEYIECIDCVTEFKVDCMSDAGVGDGNPAAGIDYPGDADECNACVADVTGEPCPTVMQLDPVGQQANLDSGWTGISHDFAIPTGGRLTFAVSGCAGSERPICGDCNLTGPQPNAGGTEFANRRCFGDGSWVQCSTDMDCTNAGVSGPCINFFGPPLPTSAGGVPVCVTNQINGTLTGTANFETGHSEINVKLIARAHTGIALSRPCPVCENNVCSAGSRSGQPCVVNGTSALFGDLSLDCPPNNAGVIGVLPISLVNTTGTQTMTLSAASPSCSAAGLTSKKCFCDTCNDETNTPCTSDADCLAIGASVCGGQRCLGGTNLGDPCSAPSDCLGGGQCGVPGQPTSPNQCSSTVCTPNPSDTETVDEGVCSTGPFDLLCSVERFRGCLSNANCNPPPDGTCLDCVPGQVCQAESRECYTDDGVIGGDVTVAGAPDVACTDTARPSLGALFCVPPTAESAPNTVAGLPGLGRLALPVNITLDP
jgi:hypothetical protein